MADTTFIDGTVIVPDWLNDVNDATYTKLANVTTISAAAATVLDDASTSAMRSTLGAAASGANTDITSLSAPALGAATATTAAPGTNTTQVATTAFVLANSVPAGTIIDFAGTAAPTGYLACPLTATNISRTTYAALFAAIGTTWGAGDGSTTFGQPYFPADYAAGQANANVGSTTTGANLAHTHAMNADGRAVAKRFGADTMIDGSSSTSSADDANYSGSQDTGSSGGSANLAASMRVLKCVKL